jgi:hypothetical protein
VRRAPQAGLRPACRSMRGCTLEACSVAGARPVTIGRNRAHIPLTLVCIRRTLSRRLPQAGPGAGPRARVRTPRAREDAPPPGRPRRARVLTRRSPRGSSEGEHGYCRRGLRPRRGSAEGVDPALPVGGPPAAGLRGRCPVLSALRRTHAHACRDYGGRGRVADPRLPEPTDASAPAGDEPASRPDSCLAGARSAELRRDRRPLVRVRVRSEHSSRVGRRRLTTSGRRRPTSPHPDPVRRPCIRRSASGLTTSRAGALRQPADAAGLEIAPQWA